MRPTLHDIKALAQSYHPLVVLETVEEERVTGLTRQLAFELGIPHMEWSVQQGLFRTGTDPIYETTEPKAMLSRLIDLQLEVIVHLKDLAPHLENVRVARAFREVLMKFGSNHSTVVLSGSPVSLPPEIDHMAVHVELKLPDRQVLRGLLQETLNAVRQNHNVSVTLSPEDAAALIEALAGLTIDQARQILAWAMIQDELLSALDIQRILERKARLVHETSVLEYYPLHANRYRIGGFDRLREWLDRAKLGFSERAKAMNIGAPRGILLVGVQGCGKSLAAKFIAREWQMPLLKLDAGQLYDKYIGESERNFRQATGVAESMAPVVLWIDEIEKGFGTGRAREEDGGLSSRLFGAMLTWLQEKDERVFVVATANDLDNLPPELLRKGRFDEIFFVDLPRTEDREEIFRIHLQTRNQEPSRFALEELSAVSDGFSGAEIEQVVVSSLYESLYRNQALDTKTIIEECARAVPLSKSRQEEIEEIRRKGSRFVPVK